MMSGKIGKNHFLNKEICFRELKTFLVNSVLCFLNTVFKMQSLRKHYSHPRTTAIIKKNNAELSIKQ